MFSKSRLVVAKVLNLNDSLVYEQKEKQRKLQKIEHEKKRERQLKQKIEREKKRELQKIEHEKQKIERENREEELLKFDPMLTMENNGFEDLIREDIVLCGYDSTCIAINKIKWFNSDGFECEKFLFSKTEILLKYLNEEQGLNCFLKHYYKTKYLMFKLRYQRVSIVEQKTPRSYNPVSMW